MQLSLSNMLLVVVVVASIVSATALAPQILAPREAEVYQLAVYASSKPHAGGVIVDFKVVNVGRKPVELRKVQVDGGFVEVAPRKRELMPGEVYEDSILLPGLSAGEHSISVEASGGGTPLYGSSKFLTGSEAGGSPQQPKSLQCRVEKRPIYEVVKVRDRVWTIVGHEKVPKYEYREKKVCGSIHHYWWSFGYRWHYWWHFGYRRHRSEGKDYCYTVYRKVCERKPKTICSVIWRYRFCRQVWVMECKYEPVEVCPSSPGCWIEREKVLVGYEEKPVYGWKEVERTEKRLKGYEEVIVCE